MNYKRILNSFRKKNILIVGDVILDHFIWGDVDRISPEAPVPIVDVQSESYLLGGAGNVACNITALNANASIAGIVGNDHRSEILKNLFSEKGINTKGIISDSRPTTVKTRVIAHSQQVVRFDREKRDHIGSAALKRLRDFISSHIKQFDAVIISDYKKGVITHKLVQFTIEAAKPYSLFIAVDPKVGHFHYYKGASLITPNKKEASEESGVTIKDKKTLKKAGDILLKKFHCGSVLITKGEEGMSLFTANSAYDIPTVARDVYDVTGAGDTVISVFTLSYVSGASMFNSAEIANHAAGIVVGEVGTATATIEKIQKSLSSVF